MANKGLTTAELITIFDTPLTTNSNGLTEYAVYDQANHCICIKFDKVFNRPDIKQHTIFKIQHKRYYSEGTANSTSKPMLPTICNDINYVLNKNMDVIRLFTAFNLKIALKEKREYPLDDFKKDVYDLVSNIKDDIVEYVNENYQLELDVSESNVNTDLQVTDEMNKVYIESAIAMRIVIPILCSYTLNEKIDNIFYDVFREIMIIFSENNDNGYNPLTKLRSIVRSRVEQTKYANKKIWNFIANYGNDMKLECEDFYKQLIESIIPKLDINRSAIKYIDVVLRKKLEFLFTFNFTYEYRPLRNLENDDDTDERDRLNETIFTSSRNEASLALNKLTIKNHIQSFMDDNDITKEQVNEFKANNLKNKNLNNIQNYFIFIAFGKIFEVKIASEAERVVLLYELIETLKNEGFTELPKILSSTVENEVDIRNKVGGKKLRSQRGFLQIMNKYENVINVIDNDNFIVKMISFKNHVYHDANDNNISIDSNNFEREIISFILSL